MDSIESQRERQLAHLKSAFAMIKDHVVVTDADSHILYANPAAEHATGYTLLEMLGRTPGQLWGGKMPKEFYENMWHVIKKEKQPFVGEVKNTRKTGEEFWQELHISPVLDNAGDIRFFIAIEPVVTDRKKRQEFTESFTAMAAHQMKTPLVSLRWALEWITENVELKKDESEALSQAYEKNIGLIDLVTDLMFLSRIGGLPSVPEPCEIAELATRCVGAVAKRFPDAAINKEIPSEKVLVMIPSPVLAEQVIMNLVTNAAEYARPGDKKIIVRLFSNEKGYVFSCEDNGIGIPDADQSRVFERFFRSANAIDAKPVGSGIGLFIVKQACAALGWGVSFESHPGRTVFTVTIPKSS